MALEVQGFEVSYETAPEVQGFEIAYEAPQQVQGFEIDLDPQPYNLTGSPWTATSTSISSGGAPYQPPSPVWQDD